MELVRRYPSHPSILVWVPVDESWGMQDMATVAAQGLETNGLLTAGGTPKIPVPDLFRIVTGRTGTSFEETSSTFGTPD